MWEKVSPEISQKAVKVLARIVNARQLRRNDGYIAATALTGDAAVDDVFLPPADDLESKMPLPPRYRFRDLLLGDFAFTDDGQRWVTSINFVLFSVRTQLLRIYSNYIHSFIICLGDFIKCPLTVCASWRRAICPSQIAFVLSVYSVSRWDCPSVELSMFT